MSTSQITTLSEISLANFDIFSITGIIKSTTNKSFIKHLINLAAYSKIFAVIYCICHYCQYSYRIKDNECLSRQKQGFMFISYTRNFLKEILRNSVLADTLIFLLGTISLGVWPQIFTVFLFIDIAILLYLDSVILNEVLILWFPALISISASVVFFVPSQTHDIYRSLADVKSGTFLLSPIILSLIIWYYSNHLSSKRIKDAATSCFGGAFTEHFFKKRSKRHFPLTNILHAENFFYILISSFFIAVGLNTLTFFLEVYYTANPNLLSRIANGNLIGIDFFLFLISMIVILAVTFMIFSLWEKRSDISSDILSDESLSDSVNPEILNTFSKKVGCLIQTSRLLGILPLISFLLGLIVSCKGVIVEERLYRIDSDIISLLSAYATSISGVIILFCLLISCAPFLSKEVTGKIRKAEKLFVGAICLAIVSVYLTNFSLFSYKIISYNESFDDLYFSFHLSLFFCLFIIFVFIYFVDILKDFQKNLAESLLNKGLAFLALSFWAFQVLSFTSGTSFLFELQYQLLQPLLIISLFFTSVLTIFGNFQLGSFHQWTQYLITKLSWIKSTFQVILDLVLISFYFIGSKLFILFPETLRVLFNQIEGLFQNALDCVRRLSFSFDGVFLVFRKFLDDLRSLCLILLMLAVVFSFLNWNDNHGIRPLDGKRSEDRTVEICGLDNAFKLCELDKAFEVWLSNRRDDIDLYNKDNNKPFPIYLVSAQGGGIYAAYHAASSLSQLQEQTNGEFSKHVFAISSTSGGSLGSAIFSSLVKFHSDQDFREMASDILSQDFLSPLLNAALFPDLIQRFLPISIEAFDRAKALEYAFESAWSRVSASEYNPFTASFYTHWNPEEDAPALLINTTIVETGEQLLISPFSVSLPFLKSIDYYNPCINFRMSTAVGLSARFPIITPVGWFRGTLGGEKNPRTCSTNEKHADGLKIRLADGGYFENSGVSTALAVGQELQKIIDEHRELKDSIKITYLSIIDHFQSSDQQLKDNADGWLNESLSPLRTLGAVRSARAQSIVCQAEQSENKPTSQTGEVLCNDIDSYIDVNSDSNFEDDNFRKLLLAKPSGLLPLGWYLSRSVQKNIDCQVGFNSDQPIRSPTPWGECLRHWGYAPDEIADIKIPMGDWNTAALGKALDLIAGEYDGVQESNEEFSSDWKVRSYNDLVVASVRAELFPDTNVTRELEPGEIQELLEFYEKLGVE